MGDHVPGPPLHEAGRTLPVSLLEGLEKAVELIRLGAKVQALLQHSGLPSFHPPAGRISPTGRSRPVIYIDPYYHLCYLAVKEMLRLVVEPAGAESTDGNEEEKKGES
jgi:hypothetical protein